MCSVSGRTILCRTTVSVVGRLFPSPSRAMAETKYLFLLCPPSLGCYFCVVYMSSTTVCDMSFHPISWWLLWHMATVLSVGSNVWYLQCQSVYASSVAFRAKHSYFTAQNRLHKTDQLSSSMSKRADSKHLHFYLQLWAFHNLWIGIGMHFTISLLLLPCILLNPSKWGNCSVGTCSYRICRLYPSPPIPKAFSFEIVGNLMTENKIIWNNVIIAMYFLDVQHWNLCWTNKCVWEETWFGQFNLFLNCIFI